MPGSMRDGMKQKSLPTNSVDSRLLIGLLHVILVGRAGVEPTTNGLKVRCSTN